MPPPHSISFVGPLRLRPVTARDLDVMYQIQKNPECNAMAGTKPRTREGFFAIWDRIFADAAVRPRVIEVDGDRGPEIAGSISTFQADGHDCVGYWIARSHWGKGIGSRAVAMFLEEETRRPLYATAASSNAASRRILEKCGFRLLGLRMGEETERFMATEVAEYVVD